MLVTRVHGPRTRVTNIGDGLDIRVHLCSREEMDQAYSSAPGHAGGMISHSRKYYLWREYLKYVDHIMSNGNGFSLPLLLSV